VCVRVDRVDKMGKGMNQFSNGNIVDEGILKYVEQFIQMNKEDLNLRYYNDFARNSAKLISAQQWDMQKFYNDDMEEDKQIEFTKVNTLYDEVYYDFEEVKRLERLKVKIAINRPQPQGYVVMKSWEDITRSEIYTFYGLKEFQRCWMLNISPNWNATTYILDSCKCDFIMEVMNIFYKDFGRWARMKYVIECGKNGDFIHVHAVFELSKLKYKGTMTAIKKGNIYRSFRSIWDSVAKNDGGEEGQARTGFVGLAKGVHSLNSCLIMNNEILQDKLNYLLEDKKSEGHKNAEHPLCPIVHGENTEGWID
jgi:hypothetical protein